MEAKLISYTQPVKEILEQGVESSDLVAFIARVSNPGNQMNTETADRLIRFLVRNKHWSPLQFVDATFEIETTRDISRQALRHQSFDFQEFSGRYSQIPGFELSECRMQDEKNRQNSLPCVEPGLQQWWENAQQQVINLCDDVYKAALKEGIAKEVARKVLPEGLTKTKMYMKGSLRSWVHYLEVRNYEGCQKEHRLIAQEIADILQKCYPTVFGSLH